MSTLRRSLEEYLTLRTALGFQLRRIDKALHKFISFMEEQSASYITTELALRWAKQPTQTEPAYWARRFNMVRRFAQYQCATDPRTQIPPKGLLPHTYRRKPPRIYSDSEIADLLKSAKKLPSSTGLDSWTYSALFGLLAVTGMRSCEALALNREDIDLGNGILTIRETKFHKSRMVPIHLSTKLALQQYARRRDDICQEPKTPSFFISDQGRRVTYDLARSRFLYLASQIGLQGPSHRSNPRLHDLRHRFAVQTLLGWYRAGLDVNQRMPLLSAYLGHGLTSSTYWYLSAVPELLQLAAKRLDNRKGRKLS